MLLFKKEKQVIEYILKHLDLVEDSLKTGIKTIESDKTITNNYVDDHLRIGLDSLKELKEEGHSVKHLRF